MVLLLSDIASIERRSECYYRGCRWWWRCCCHTHEKCMLRQNNGNHCRSICQSSFLERNLIRTPDFVFEYSAGMDRFEHIAIGNETARRNSENRPNAIAADDDGQQQAKSNENIRFKCKMIRVMYYIENLHMSKSVNQSGYFVCRVIVRSVCVCVCVCVL